MNVLVHGAGEGTAVLQNVPDNVECGTVYDLVSRVCGVPAQMLTLSNGVKILQHNLPLSHYTSLTDSSHRLNLYCNMRLPGGGGGLGDIDSCVYIAVFYLFACANIFIGIYIISK